MSKSKKTDLFFQTFKAMFLSFQVMSAFSDGLYASPAVFSAGTFFRKTKDTYFYHFSHQTKSGPYATVSEREGPISICEMDTCRPRSRFKDLLPSSRAGHVWVLRA